jgi:DoxX-like protein
VSEASGVGSRDLGWRSVGYWISTLLVVGELVVGGLWDIARIPAVSVTVTGLGYPSYFLTLLGTWKLLGAIALVTPGRPVLKEWAYAGVVFVYSGAIFSHIAASYALGEIPVLTFMLGLTAVSLTLRPASRRVATGSDL